MRRWVLIFFAGLAGCTFGIPHDRPSHSLVCIAAVCELHQLGEEATDQELEP